MSNRLLVPKRKRLIYPRELFAPNLIIPGIMPIPQAPTTVTLGPPGIGLTAASGTDTPNDGTGTVGAIGNAAAQTLLCLFIAREGTGDVTSTTTVTDNKGNTWHQRATVANFHSVVTHWYRLELWWTYVATAQTSISVTFTFFRGSTTSNTFYSAIGFTNIPKAIALATPFFNGKSGSGVTNPVTATHDVNSNTTPTTSSDPQTGATFNGQFITLSGCLYRDTQTSTPTAGSGFTLIAAPGNHTSSGNASLETEYKSSSGASGVQSVTFTRGETFWDMLTDVVDGS